MRHTEAPVGFGREGYADDGYRPRWVIAAYMDAEPACLDWSIISDAED
jgi:hypothetical protein